MPTVKSTRESQGFMYHCPPPPRSFQRRYKTITTLSTAATAYSDRSPAPQVQRSLLDAGVVDEALADEDDRSAGVLVDESSVDELDEPAV